MPKLDRQYPDLQEHLKRLNKIWLLIDDFSPDK